VTKAEKNNSYSLLFDFFIKQHESAVKKLNRQPLAIKTRHMYDNELVTQFLAKVVGKQHESAVKKN
jgi:hypothetical protein